MKQYPDFLCSLTGRLLLAVVDVVLYVARLLFDLLAVLVLELFSDV